MRHVVSVNEEGSIPLAPARIWRYRLMVGHVSLKDTIRVQFSLALPSNIYLWGCGAMEARTIFTREMRVQFSLSLPRSEPKTLTAMYYALNIENSVRLRVGSPGYYGT